jgi:hypothetical protein
MAYSGSKNENALDGVHIIHGRLERSLPLHQFLTRIFLVLCPGLFVYDKTSGHLCLVQRTKKLVDPWRKAGRINLVFPY